ncbi:hypothetical protein ACFQ9X_19815 [Catenulispora yoronensis]
MLSARKRTTAALALVLSGVLLASGCSSKSASKTADGTTGGSGAAAPRSR